MELTKAELEDRFLDLFSPAGSSSGEEEMIRVASEFASQYTARQIKALIFLEVFAGYLSPFFAQKFLLLAKRWVEYKRHNNSDAFVMAAIQNISLRKFLNENSFKVDIQK